MACHWHPAVGTQVKEGSKGGSGVDIEKRGTPPGDASLSLKIAKSLEN
jgi:hypothetical protein